MNKIDPTLLKRLACPACDNRPKLKQTPEGLYCANCERIYPITDDDIPILLVDEAIVKPAESVKKD